MTLPRYLDATRENLLAILARARSLAEVLEDVHSLAYDKASSRDGEGRSGHGGERFEYYLDEQGQERAKKVLRSLSAEVETLAKRLEVSYAQVFSLFAAPSANERMRGTMLGNDKGHGAQTELKVLQARQAARRRRGEYTPAASEEQPEVPTR